MIRIDRRWIAASLFLAIVLASHGLLLVNPVLITDDWLYAEWLGSRDWRVLHGVHVYAGDFLLEYYFRTFSYFGDPLVTFRVASFGYIVASAWTTYLICIELGYLSRPSSALIALLSAVYPAYMMHTSLTLSAYQFCYLLFLLGALLGLRSERLSGAAHVGMRGGALALLFLSFAANSLLLFYAGFLVLHVLRVRGTNGFGWWQAVTHYLSRRADYLLIPIVFWGVRTAFRLFHETNPEYNAIRLDPETLGLGITSYAITLKPQLARIIGSPLLYIALVPCLLLAIRRESPLAAPPQAVVLSAGTLLFGFFLLACGVLPYILVGKGPNGDLDHWETRTLLLFGLPMSVILVSAGNLLADSLHIGRRFLNAFLLAVIVSCCGVQVRHYLKLHSYSIEYQSLLLNLAAHEGAREYSIFGVVSRLDSLGITHIKYTWPYYLRMALGGRLDRTAIVEPGGDVNLARSRTFTAQQIRMATTDWWARLYGFEVPLDGRQAVLVVDLGPGRRELTDARLVLRYLRLKYTQPEQLRRFLEGVTLVTVLPKAP